MNDDLCPGLCSAVGFCIAGTGLTDEEILAIEGAFEEQYERGVIDMIDSLQYGDPGDPEEKDDIDAVLGDLNGQVDVLAEIVADLSEVIEADAAYLDAVGLRLDALSGRVDVIEAGPNQVPWEVESQAAVPYQWEDDGSMPVKQTYGCDCGVIGGCNRLRLVD